MRLKILQFYYTFPSSLATFFKYNLTEENEHKPVKVYIFVKHG